MEAMWWLAALLGALATGLIGRKLSLRPKRMSREERIWEQRKARALRGEEEAESLLKSLGFKILERQAERVWYVYLNEKPVRILLRADLLVARRGKKYVAEVKTGRKAPLITTSQTRRQLLEYQEAYTDCVGVLLVDMEKEKVHHVTFSTQDDPRTHYRGFWLWLFGALTGAAAVLWWTGELRW